MKSGIYPIVFGLILLFAGCGKIEPVQKVEPAAVDSEKVDENFLRFQPLHEIVWDNDEFSLKMPCEFDKSNRPEPDASLATEVSQSNKCEFSNLTFKVTSRKSKESLRAEFEKIKNEKSGLQKQGNGYIFCDYSRTISSIKNNQDGVPAPSDVLFEVTKNRLHLINDKWSVNFEVSCKSRKKDYCENLLINSENEKISEFLGSFKLNSNK